MYKQVKDNNRTTGASPQISQFYDGFHEVLGTREVINLKTIVQVDMKKDGDIGTSLAQG